MPKDDPLSQGPRSNPTTLWLDREHMEESRDAYWLSYRDAQLSRLDTVVITERHQQWDIAYAAAVAVFEFLMSGKMRPGP